MREPIGTSKHAAATRTDSPARESHFLIGRNPAGRWIVREASGRSAGLFASMRAAVAFAHRQAFGRRVVLVPVNDALEFDFAA
jgi:hypothetical protein